MLLLLADRGGSRLTLLFRQDIRRQAGNTDSDLLPLLADGILPPVPCGPQSNLQRRLDLLQLIPKPDLRSSDPKV